MGSYDEAEDQGSVVWALVKGFGLLLLGAAAILGGLFGLIVAHDSITQPIGQGHHPLPVLVAGIAATCALGLVAAKAKIEPVWAKAVIVGLAVLCGLFSYFVLTDWDSARKRVSDYCSYGAASQ